MRLPFSTLALLFAATPLFGQAPVGQAPVEQPPPPAAPPKPTLKVGDTIPTLAIDELSQTKASSYSDFCGRAVLLEFFAFWCGPCALSVPHLNELHEKFGPRGLSVVAVTTENAKKTVPWIEKNGVRYAYGRDTTSDLHRMFKIETIPNAVLIDSFGTVVWMGNPTRLTDETIEGVLSGTLPQPVWEWPEEARPLAKLLDKGDYATALQEAAKLAPREGFDAPAIVRGRFGPLVTKFEQLVESADYISAMRLGDRLEKGLATVPEGEPVVTRMNALRADAGISAQVLAETRISELEARAGALRKVAEAEELRADVAKFLETKPGPKIERRAKILLDTIDRGLEKAAKKPKTEQG